MATVWNWYFGQNTQAPAPLAGGTKVPDEWWERIVKGVPVEVAGAYTAAIPIAKAAFDKPETKAWVMAIVFVVGVIFTLLAMKFLRELQWNDADGPKRRIARVQISVALVAFVVWAYAQGGVFAVWTIQAPNYSGPAYHDGVAALLGIATGFLLLIANKIAGTE